MMLALAALFAVLGVLGGLAYMYALGWRTRAGQAREAVRGVDVEYALLTDEFGDDGLWP